MDAYLRLLSFLRPYRARVAVAVLAALVFAGATSLYAFLLGPLLKVLLTGGVAQLPVAALNRLSREQMLVALPLALVATAAVRASAQALQSFLMQSTGQRIVADLRRALYARFLRLPQAWLSRHHSGDLVSRFGVDVQAVEFSLTVAFSSYVKDTLQILTLMAVCAWLDWRLLLAALAVAPLAALPLSAFARGLKRVSDRCQAALGALTGQVGESVANVRVVQAFCREDDELARFDAGQRGFLRLMRTSFMLRAGFSPVVEMLGVAGVAATIYFAGSSIAAGTLSGEALLSFLAALMLMYRPVKELSTTWQHVIQGLAGARRIFQVLDATGGPADPAEPVAARFERELAFRGVGFAYDEEPVLRNVDITVPRGRTLALVGESGSGKSTLASLLLRFYDPVSGAVELDGVDVRRMRVDDVRGLIAFVPQEPVLFAGTVRDNVGCGREGAGEPEIRAALEAAHAWEFVSRMPGGLDAEVGERGAGLSGGQRQRIALARAFLADAPIIVLDEATSALDSASEALVQQGLDALLRERTAVVIAHRLSTIERADEIVVLAGGRVIERGTHQELLASGRAYAALHAAQSSVQAPAAASGVAPRLVTAS